MSEVKRIEPQDLTDQKWLETDQFFASSNVVNTTDEGEHLELEENNALDFDGDNDYVELGTIATDNVLQLYDTDFSISVWLKPAGSGDNSQRIIDKSDGGFAANGWAFSFPGDPLDGFSFFANGGTVFTEQGSNTADTWTHVVLVKDASGSYKLYQDNVLVGSYTGKNNPPSIEKNARIGTWNHSDAREYDGTMSDLRIYNSALTSANVTSLYGGEDLTTNLIAHWKLDEGTGTTAGDSAGDNDGTIEGATWVSSYSDFPPYFGEGNRVSNPLSLDAIKKVKSSNIKFTKTTPTDTDLKIYTAISDSNTVEPNTEEEQTLFLGNATGGTFTLGDGTTNTSAIAYDATAATIQTALEAIYGSGLVSVVADTDFTITFDISVGVSDLEANFTSLTGATSPALTLDDAVDYSEEVSDTAIDGISVDADLTGKYLWVRQELSTTATASTPRLSTLEYEVVGVTEAIVTDTAGITDTDETIVQAIAEATDTIEISDEAETQEPLLRKTDTAGVTDTADVFHLTALDIFINGTQVSEHILKESITLIKNLTDQIDSGNLASKTYKPSPMDEIEIYRNGKKIFGGVITEVNHSFRGGYSPFYDVEFQDYTIEMDQRYVIDTFEDKSVAEIVNYVAGFYLSEKYTTNVDVNINISRISFDWRKPSQVFEELADTIECEWYLDENRVINFYRRGDITGESITPTSNIAFWNTIEHQESLEQLKNRVYVRGGRQTSTDPLVKHLNEQIDDDNDILHTGYTYIYRRDENDKIIEPILTFNGVAQEIGIENEDAFTSTRSSLTTDFGSNRDIRYDSVEYGEGANDISIEYVITAPNQTLGVSVTGKKITVSLESNYNSEPRSTANEVASEINDVTNLVSALTVVGQTGEGVVPTMTETNLSGGSEGVDVLYNQDEKVLHFATAPVAGDKPVLLSGRIRIPIQVVLNNHSSQEEYGVTLEHLIQDTTISSTDEAQKKALVELSKFAQALESGTFATHNDDYRPGQQFRLTVPEFELDDDYIVRSVQMQSDGGDEMYYRIGYMTKRSKELVDLLKSLITTQRTPTEAADLLEKIDSIIEENEWEHSVTENPLAGADIVWVAGPYYPTSPTDPERVPRVGGGVKAS